MTETRKKGRQGFASLSPEKRRENAGRAGRIAHLLGRAHEWTHDEAVAAGRKGGSAPKRPRQSKADGRAS